MSSNITVTREGPLAFVSLARPEKLNALTPEMKRDLRAAWMEVEADPNIRVAVLRGEGRSFCVGNDLSPGARRGVHRSAAEDRVSIGETLETAFAAWNLSKPVIAQVQGHCLAAGLLLIALSDVILYAENARLGWPRLPVGGGMISPLLSWTIGPFRAKEYSFDVGATLSGEDAVAMGLGNRAGIPLQELELETKALAQRFARLPAEMLQIKKAAINQQFEAKGFRNAVLRGAEMDALFHTTAGVALVRERLQALGMAGAIDWFQREGIPDVTKADGA